MSSRFWGSGFGPTNPELDPAKLVPAAAPLANPVDIRIGSAAAVVQYAGMTASGLNQFNIVVPDLPNGDYPVVAQVAGVRTAAIVRLRIQL